MKIPLLLAAIVLAAVTASPRATAAPSLGACTGFITSVPVVITTQGTWCLDADLSTAITSGNAIVVATNNVTIDCNGYKLGGLAAGPGSGARGIHANGRVNLTVRDCNIRGFFIGIEIGGTPSSGHLIQDNRIEASASAGVWLSGTGSRVAGNRILDTGVTGLLTGASWGIFATGTVDVVENTVDGVTAMPIEGDNFSTIGIAILSGDGSQVSGNRIRDLVSSGTGTARGISLTLSVRTDVRDNFVRGPGTVGISCTGNNPIYRNHVTGFTTALSNCADAGNLLVP